VSVARARSRSGVRAAQQQRAEPVGLGGGDHAEFLAGAQPSAHCTFGCLQVMYRVITRVNPVLSRPGASFLTRARNSSPLTSRAGRQ
jgi:hypothetical protein